MKSQWVQYKRIINSVVKTALGCTEPISAAYAAALITQILDQTPEQLSITVSDNLYKNAMGVTVPGTGSKGLHIAAAAGAVGGNPDLGLEVLRDIKPHHIEAAQKLIDDNKIHINAEASDSFIYCQATGKAGNNTATVVIKEGHTRVTEKTLNGQSLFSEHVTATPTGSVCDGVDISVREIYDYAVNVPASEILFINEAADINCALSKEGLSRPYGLQIGLTMKQQTEQQFFGGRAGQHYRDAHSRSF